MQQEVHLRVAGGDAERLADALLAAGALAVTIEDAAADGADEEPLYGEPGHEPQRRAWRENRVAVLLDEQADAESLVRTAAIAVGLEPPAIGSKRTVGDADWVRLTQSQFAPLKIGEHFWIVPTWHEPPEADALNIRLDPGVAFGTGAHPTTFLCLSWLTQARLAGRRVLDYGCGSGILAIAAARLGAAEVIGTDIDDQALGAARTNSALNDVAARYTDPSGVPAGKFDVVIANILTNALIVLAPTLLARLAPGGQLVLSGILARQADAVVDAYRALDKAMMLAVWRTIDDWACIVGERRH